jgi:hypothetical protein
MAQGYNGGKSTSTANQEILPLPSGWNVNRQYYEFSFLNTQACTIKINGSGPIPLDPEQGLQIDANDSKIYSLVIVEAGIDFKWFGKF